MKYQVFLKTKDNQMCSFTVNAKNEKVASQKALQKAKETYNLDFQVFKIFKENWKDVKWIHKKL